MVIRTNVRSQYFSWRVLGFGGVALASYLDSGAWKLPCPPPVKTVPQLSRFECPCPQLALLPCRPTPQCCLSICWAGSAGRKAKTHSIVPWGIGLHAPEHSAMEHLVGCNGTPQVIGAKCVTWQALLSPMSPFRLAPPTSGCCREDTHRHTHTESQMTHPSPEGRDIEGAVGLDRNWIGVMWQKTSIGRVNSQWNSPLERRGEWSQTELAL